jgi:fatty-acid desaturase
VEASIDEWMGLMKRLHDATETERDDLDPVLKDLMANNTRWLSVTQAQFADEIAHLR